MVCLDFHTAVFSSWYLWSISRCSLLPPFRQRRLPPFFLEHSPARRQGPKNHSSCSFPAHGDLVLLDRLVFDSGAMAFFVQRCCGGALAYVLPFSEPSIAFCSCEVKAGLPWRVADTGRFCFTLHSKMARYVFFFSHFPLRESASSGSIVLSAI